MNEPVQIMVLPGDPPQGSPRILFDDGAVWREMGPMPATQAELHQELGKFLSGVMQRVGADPPQPVSPQGLGFRNLFNKHFQALLAAELRETLIRAARAADAAAGSRPYLKIFFRSGAEWIPWELLHDGTNYLGTRFAIARLPIVKEPTELRPPHSREVRTVYSLLAKNVLNGSALNEWQSTFGGYAKTAQWLSRFPANGNANYPSLNELEDAKNADILHFTCHGGLKDEMSGEYYWTLDHLNPAYFDYRITPTIAQSVILSSRPLVFGNACASVAAQTIDLASLQGFGSSFLVAGALNFIGTFAPITKTMAVAFAKRFYERLLGTAQHAGLPIAEALRATKQSFADENCADPSYLFYCLYGPADSTYEAH